MTKTIIISFAAFIIISILTFVWFYLFNIYEVKIHVVTESRILKTNEKIEINVIPLNSFGTHAFFRNISAEFEILKGSELITIKYISGSSIAIFSKGEQGNAEILVTPSIGLFPSKITIKVE